MVVAGLGVGVWAFLTAGATPGTGGQAKAGTLPTGNQPTLSLASRDVTVSWAQNSPAFLGGPLGADANGGYLIKRYAESGGGAITPGASCSGLQQGAASPLTCTESSTPIGRWQYTVTPKYYNWLGNESAQSASVIIAPTAPTTVTLVNGGGVGSVWVNQANRSSLSVDVGLPATSLATDTVYLTISDGSNPNVTANLPATAGAGTVHFTGLNVSGLNDGPLSFNAKSQSSLGDNSGTTSNSYSKDATNPTVVVAASRAPDSNGWYNHAVTFSTSPGSSDAGSGLQSCQADVVYSGPDGTGFSVSRSCTDNAGNTASASSATFKYDGTNPTVTSVTADRGPDNGTWYNHSVTWTASGTDATSGIASCQSIAYTGPDTSGTTVNRTCTDSAGNSGSGTSATFKYDATAPGVTVTPARAPDQAGWYNAPVTFTANGSDATSGVASCQAAVNYTGPDGTGLTVSRTCTDNAGNTGNGTSGVFQFDDTNPSVSLSPTPSSPNGSNGWYVSPVTWHATQTDATSGPGTCASDITYSGPDSSTATVSRTCTDNAGNVGTGTSSTFKYDDHAPNVTVNASPSSPNGSNGWYKSAVTFSAAGIDPAGGSGGVTCQSNLVYSGPDGNPLTVNRTCTDNAGNVGTGTSATFKYDATAPTLSLAMTTPAASGNALASGFVGTTIYFNNCAGSNPATPGGFRLVSTVGDTTSGAASANYPSLSAARWTTHANETVSTPSGGPYTSSDFLWDAGNCGGQKADTPGNYTITAADAAGNTTTVTVTFDDDETNPTVTLTHPTNGTTYSASSWNSACASTICGGSGDTGGAGVLRVELSIRQGSGNYWNGTGFSSASQVFNVASGTTSWTYAFPASNFPADGSYTVSVRSVDNAQNVSSATSRTFTIDTTPPSVSSISRAVSSPTKAASVSWTVTFSESVTGVNTADFSLVQSGGVSGASITNVTGSGPYTVNVNTGTGDGSLGLNLVDDDSIADSVGNKLGGTGTGNGNFTGQVYTVDKTSPTLSSIAATNSDGAIGAGDTLTFTYSDANGVDPASVVSGWDGSGTRTVNVTFTNNNASTGNNDSITFAAIGVVNLGSQAWWTGSTVTRTATLSMTATNTFRITFNAGQLPNSPGTGVAASTFTWSATGGTAADAAGNVATGSAPGSTQRF